MRNKTIEINVAFAGTARIVVEVPKYVDAEILKEQIRKGEYPNILDVESPLMDWKVAQLSEIVPNNVEVAEIQ